jgi:hypothetical protein
MPKYGPSQTVQAKLDPTGTYLVCRISGSGQDRYERRRVVDVENNVNHTFGKLARSHSQRRRLRRWDGKIDGTMQGCATLGVRLWRYTGNADRTDPAALTE